MLEVWELQFWVLVGILIPTLQACVETYLQKHHLVHKATCRYPEHKEGRSTLPCLNLPLKALIVYKSIMPLSKAQRRQIYASLSSIVEHSFLDDRDGDAADDASRRRKQIIAAHTPSLSSSPIPIAQQQKQTNHRHVQSFVVVYTMIFFNGCCFTAVVPSVPFYLQLFAAPPSFLGLVVSFYSLGQICGSTLLASWLNDKLNSKTLLTLTSAMGLVGSIFYVIASNQWHVLFSRWLTGISAGWEFTTELAFIARNTTCEERTVFLASVTALNVVGFLLGPGLSTLISMLKFNVMGLEINEYTGPGWLLVIMFVIDLIMVRACFQESSAPLPSESKQNKLLLDEKENGGYGATNKDIDTVESQINPEQHPTSLLVIASLIFVQFTLMCAWSVLETITSPLAEDSFGWHIAECNMLYTCGGAASLLAYISFVVASKRIEDRVLICVAIGTCFVGLMLMVAWSSPMLPPYLWRFIAGYLIMNAGFMTGRPVTIALFSKLIPERYQGSYLGIMVAGGSTARTVGPFLAVFCYYHIEEGGDVLFGSIAAIMITCLAVMCMLWSSFVSSATGTEKSSGVVVLSHHSDNASIHVSTREQSAQSRTT